MPASIFARLRDHLARFGGDVIPLHIGDTHLPPAVALDAFDWRDLPQAELYAYGAPPGWTPLVDAIAAKLARKNGIEATAATIQITAGATHALSCAVSALCDPGDELILVTPHWPLIRGIALAHHVVPVEVALDQLEAAITPKTTGLYVASPNNPDGAMLSPADVERIARLARERDLWIFSDEVYEDYVYDGAHVSVAPRAPERTVTVFSCSKGYAQAGLRVGYVVGPPLVIEGVRKLANHSVFNVPVAMQRAAHAAITSGDAFLASARQRYRAARDRARARLRAPAALPPGGAYLWVDFGGDDCMPVLERIAAAGVLVAPGNAFGDACGRFARLCFTGVDEARLDEGIDRINRVL
ncbi:MAG TPA: pyridoxal phosphate-dependent aminotransferase [Kofleriaceae bacterium]